METIINRCAEIYSWLEDEVSKGIFINRMFYNYTADKKYISDMVRNIVSMEPLALLNANLYSRGNFVLYGAGSDGSRLNDCLQICGININCFVIEEQKRALLNFKELKY